MNTRDCKEMDLCIKEHDVAVKDNLVKHMIYYFVD